MENPAVGLTMIGLVSLLCQWIAWRLRLPAILPLLIAGILLGPVFHLLDPDALLGDLLFPLVSLAVAVILFEGSLTLRFSNLRGHSGTMRNLVIWGVLITAVIGAVAAHYILGLPWGMASVLGALLVVTGPTVVTPLLQTLRARKHLTEILRWEGILIDPIGAIAAVLVYEFVVVGLDDGAALSTFLLFMKTALVGFGLGALGGYAWGRVLRQHWLPQRLHSFGTLMVMLTLFTTSNTLFHESGLLTVTIMGVWLANLRGVPTDPIKEFKETLSLVLISGLFILLAARLTAHQLSLLSWPAWIFLLVLVAVARPLSVWVCTLGSELNWREKALLAWISPRGIVAAAVASFFALKLEKAGVAGAEMLVPVTFLVIISTVVVQSLLSRPLAKWLRVTEPPPSGFLIIGANPVARTIGLALQEAGFMVRLADSHREEIKQAQMAGLDVYYGNPLSEHADTHLEMAGIGHLLPLSPQRELNNLAALHFEHLLGHGKVFRLATQRGHDKRHHQDLALGHLPLLFGKDVSYSQLASLVSQGATVHRTSLSETYTFEDYQQAHEGQLLPLFCISEAGRIRVASSEKELEPQPGESVISLIFIDSPQQDEALAQAMAETEKEETSEKELP
ncbi:cation:proton antiporter [Pistricoccus aurantiacus]|uniref:cation:proton antiporter n=1 Tax=Pistricoccus aurantiacus TaxID=1883414 RepID=UPI00363F2397